MRFIDATPSVARGGYIVRFDVREPGAPSAVCWVDESGRVFAMQLRRTDRVLTAEEMDEVRAAAKCVAAECKSAAKGAP